MQEEARHASSLYQVHAGQPGWVDDLRHVPDLRRVCQRPATEQAEAGDILDFLSCLQGEPLDFRRRVVSALQGYWPDGPGAQLRQHTKATVVQARAQRCTAPTIQRDGALRPRFDPTAGDRSAKAWTTIRDRLSHQLEPCAFR